MANVAQLIRNSKVAFQLSLLLVPFLVNVHSVQTDPIEEHELSAFNEFLHRGQSVVSDIPPLIFKYASSVQSYGVAFVERIVLFASLLCWLSLRSPSRFEYLSTIILASLLAFLGSGHKDGAYVSSVRSANVLMVVALYSSIPVYGNAKWRDIRPSSAMDQASVLIVLALLHGANPADVCSAYMLNLMVQQYDILKELSNVESSLVRALKSVALRTLKVVLRSILLPSMIILLVYAWMPRSETSGGGNVNLRFLSATARRRLSTVQRTPRHWSTMDTYIPEYAIVPYIPVTIYIPESGFLWGKSGTDDVGQFFSSVVFADPINQRHGWSFEQSTIDTGVSDLQWRSMMDDERVTGYLWSGETVQLRSRVDGLVLSVGSLSPEAHKDGETFRRYPLSLDENETLNSTWGLRCEPELDSGFTLYNWHWGCYLATTFDAPSERTPFSPPPTNDSVLHTMRLEVEAKCTTEPTKKSSTFHIIEEIDIAGDTTSRQYLYQVRKRFNQGCSIAGAFFGWGLDLLGAQLRFLLFRRNHPGMRRPASSIIMSGPDLGLLPQLEVFSVIVFALTYVSRRLWIHRYQSTIQTTGKPQGYQDHATAKSTYKLKVTLKHSGAYQRRKSYDMAAFLVMSHILFYWVLSFHRPAGGAFLFACVTTGMQNLIIDCI